MPGSRLFLVPRRTLTVALGLCCLAPVFARAQSWRAPLLGRELVIVEKTVPGESEAPRALPEAVRRKLGPDFVEYEAFVAARLPAGAAKELTEAALAEKRGVFRDTRPPSVLPFQSFHPEETEERWESRRSGLRPEPVPGLYFIRFAFPLRAEWTEALRTCGVDPILYYGNRMFLTRARNLGAIQSCQPAARYLAWADAFRVTDRTSPDLLNEASWDFASYTLEFAPGTGLDTALAELPAMMETGGHMIWDDGTLSIGVKAGRPELEALAKASLHLLAIHPAEGEPQPSDERQGQIVAGNYVGYPGAISGAVTTPGYLAWLTSRGLDTDTNPQTVAVFDTGYGNGSGPTGTQHPDLKDRLLATAGEGEACYVFNRTLPIDDTRGHGTIVAGIIAGNGAAATPVGAKDAQGFYLGMGIAPKAKLVAVQVIDSESAADCNIRTGFGDPPDYMSSAIAFSRVTASGADKATIANHSWNLGLRYYSSMARLFDQSVIDAAPAMTGAQPMNMVVSAGNEGPDRDSILSPATAKNVITVGSTHNYRPSTQTGAPANSCGSFTEDATNIAQVSTFSSRGVDFRPYNLPVVPPQLHERRIKPDVVEPGVRVASTAPHASSTYFCPRLCAANWPSGTSYSFASGTSFAAPVVTGIVAHARKWFMDRGVLNPPPAPSLIKAAIIATATDLGAVMAGDHRPSNRFGFGRSDLNMLTNPAISRFYVNERVEFAVSTGASIEWERTIDDSMKPTSIVLAWSDPASSLSSTSQVPLYNDLHLTVEAVGASLYYRGNNFYENIDGYDNGFSYPYTLGGAPLINDTMNNVETIYIPANLFWPGQKIIIRVTGIDVHGTAQRFALYGYNVRFGT